jgi:D-3-phosphoglycerate dehydrogenase
MTTPASLDRPRIWTDVRLEAEAVALLEPHATLVAGGDPALLPGCTVAIITALIDASGAWMDAAGDALRAICRPGIGVDNIDIAAAYEARHPGHQHARWSYREHRRTCRRIALSAGEAGRCVPTVSCALKGGALPGCGASRCAVKRWALSGWGASGGAWRRSVARGWGCMLWRMTRLFPTKPSLPWMWSAPQPSTICCRTAQFLSLHCALTPETRHLIGARELGLLPPGALLINVSRGAVVDQAALIAALSNGRLAGAGLDVFDPEPLPDDHPLLRLPNVILTPHIASYTADGARAMHIGVAQQVVQLLRGERPPHIVNPEAL